MIVLETPSVALLALSVDRPVLGPMSDADLPDLGLHQDTIAHVRAEAAKLADSYRRNVTALAGWKRRPHTFIVDQSTGLGMASAVRP